MGTVYSVKFQVTNQQDQQQFKTAFNDIYKLARALIKSENKEIKNYILDTTGKDDESWLEVDENLVAAWAECGSIGIERNDADNIPCEIEYYFGKAYPAPPEFLAALISIIYHYFPTAELSSDLWDQKKAFNDGMLLAALVNPNIINNPQKALVDQGNNNSSTKDIAPKTPSQYFVSVYEAFKSELIPNKRLKGKISLEERERLIIESAKEIEELIAEEVDLSILSSKRQKTAKSEDTSASNNRYGFYITPSVSSNTETLAILSSSNKMPTPQQ